MLHGGLRPGEVLNLQLEDISYARKRVIIRFRTDHPKGVRTKSRTEQVVDLLQAETLQAISDYVMHERPSDTSSPYVFLVGGRGKRRGEPLGYHALVKLFERCCERLGIRTPWITPHALRHTHATRMFEGGMRDLTLQKRLGHASPASTRIYTDVSDATVVAEYRQALQNKGHNDVLYKVSYRARPYLVFLALRGYAQFDWEWLIAIRQLRLTGVFTCAGGDMGMARLLDDACQLGFARPKTTSTFQWIVHRMLMHIGEPHVEHITDAHLIECREVLHRFAERPDVDVLYGSVQQYHKQLKDYMTYLHHLRVVLYQRGQVRSEPQRQVDRSSRRVFVVHKPYLQKTIARYLTARRVTDQPSTIKNLDLAFRQFVIWIEQTYPNIDTFAQVTREQVLEYAEMLDTRLGVVTRRPLASSSKMCISPVQSL